MKQITVIRTMDGKEPTFTKSQRFFPEEDQGFCLTIDYFENKMRQEGLTEIDAYVAKTDHSSGFAWCKAEHEFIERGEGCGNDCSMYKPRNGKSGCCVYQVNGYQSGEKVTLRLNGKKP